MERLLSLFRSTARWIGPALAALMLGVVMIGSTHHHDGALDDHHSCAICSAAHAPAVTASSVPTANATVPAARAISTPRFEPRVRLVVRGISSRAPPSI